MLEQQAKGAKNGWQRNRRTKCKPEREGQRETAAQFHRNTSIYLSSAAGSYTGASPESCRRSLQQLTGRRSAARAASMHKSRGNAARSIPTAARVLSVFSFYFHLFIYLFIFPFFFVPVGSELATNFLISGALCAASSGFCGEIAMRRLRELQLLLGLCCFA